ncbi:MAG: hypothetical protein ABSH20_14665 [Tepidisphaeraceae bacterium]|jgi:hypothetical protein
MMEGLERRVLCSVAPVGSTATHGTASTAVSVPTSAISGLNAEQAAKVQPNLFQEIYSHFHPPESAIAASGQYDSSGRVLVLVSVAGSAAKHAIALKQLGIKTGQTTDRQTPAPEHSLRAWVSGKQIKQMARISWVARIAMIPSFDASKVDTGLFQEIYNHFHPSGPIISNAGQYDGAGRIWVIISIVGNASMRVPALQQLGVKTAGSQDWDLPYSTEHVVRAWVFDAQIKQIARISWVRRIDMFIMPHTN